MDTIRVQIKGNIMILVLSSFDIAVILNKGTSFTETLDARMQHLAPELLDGRPSDMAADIWSLG